MDDEKNIQKKIVYCSKIHEIHKCMRNRINYVCIVVVFIYYFYYAPFESHTRAKRVRRSPLLLLWKSLCVRRNRRAEENSQALRGHQSQTFASQNQCVSNACREQIVSRCVKRQRRRETTVFFFFWFHLIFLQSTRTHCNNKYRHRVVFAQNGVITVTILLNVDVQNDHCILPLTSRFSATQIIFEYRSVLGN